MLEADKEQEDVKEKINTDKNEQYRNKSLSDSKEVYNGDEGDNYVLRPMLIPFKALCTKMIQNELNNEHSCNDSMINEIIDINTIIQKQIKCPLFSPIQNIIVGINNTDNQFNEISKNNSHMHIDIDENDKNIDENNKNIFNESETEDKNKSKESNLSSPFLEKSELCFTLCVIL